MYFISTSPFWTDIPEIIDFCIHVVSLNALRFIYIVAMLCSELPSNHGSALNQQRDPTRRRRRAKGITMFYSWCCRICFYENTIELNYENTLFTVLCFYENNNKLWLNWTSISSLPMLWISSLKVHLFIWLIMTYENYYWIELWIS